MSAKARPAMRPPVRPPPRLPPRPATLNPAALAAPLLSRVLVSPCSGAAAAVVALAAAALLAADVATDATVSALRAFFGASTSGGPLAPPEVSDGGVVDACDACEAAPSSVPPAVVAVAVSSDFASSFVSSSTSSTSSALASACTSFFCVSTPYFAVKAVGLVTFRLLMPMARMRPTISRSSLISALVSSVMPSLMPATRAATSSQVASSSKAR
mmetsp:Transcript_6478/g.13336  ORF Transcript_6478/g.13336 Transcript_6478/m.13336 type:complete len:214 (+) Transcript_6478:1179-1820(+)